MRLVDGDNLDADRGELQMDCPAKTPGYHKLPEKTAEVMTADGYYKTGDILRRDADGFHYFVDRVDDMFVCNGENVFPVEVEKLLESHPAIKQACVVPVDDEVRGAMPVAFVVAADGMALDTDTVKQHALAGGLPTNTPAMYGSWTISLSPARTNSIERPSLPTRPNAWQGRDQDGWTFHLCRLRSQHAGFDGDLSVGDPYGRRGVDHFACPERF